MGLQIFGTKKCRNTQKAERYFKERSISYQFVDFAEKSISKGELNNISAVIPIEDLIDKEGKEYKKKNLQYMNYNVYDVLLENSLLFKTPIVRDGGKVTYGHTPDVWKEWLKG